MVEASSVFGIIAGFLSKLGWFVALPVGVVALWYMLSRQFPSDNAKNKVVTIVKLAFMAFLGLQFPLILNNMVNK